jgi:hypothetical protein
MTRPPNEINNITGQTKIPIELSVSMTNKKTKRLDNLNEGFR